MAQDSVSKDELKKFKEIEEKYQYSYDELTPRFEKFNDYEDLYLSYISNKDNAWKSSVFDPESFEKVERMVSHLFSTRPRGRFLPREGADVKGVMIADEVFKYQWDKPGQQMHRKLMRIGRNAGIFGTGFGLLTWRYKREQKYKRNKDGSEKSYYDTTWDCPYFQDLYIYDCFPDPTAISIEDMQWFIHNEYVTLDELEETNHKHMGAKRYKNLDVLKDKVKGKRKGGATADQYRTRVNQILGNDTSLKEGRILVRRYYDRKQWVTIVPDFKLVIEDRKNPNWHGDLPIHSLTDHDYVNQLYGIGEIEPIERLQKALNSVLNMRLDNVQLIMNAPMKVNYQSKFAHEWKFAIGWKWRVERMDDVQPLEIPDVTGDTFMGTANYFKDSMAKALGHQDFTTRNETSKDKTAAEIRASGEEQNVRMRAKEFNVDGFIQRLATQWMQLNQQYLTKNTVIRIVGREAIDMFSNKIEMRKTDEFEDPETGETYTKEVKPYINGKEVDKFSKSNDGAFAFLVVEPEDLEGTYDYIAEVGSTTSIDPAQEQANLESAIKMLSDMESRLQSQGIQVDYTPLIKRDLGSLNIKNIDEVLTPIDKPEDQQVKTDNGMQGGESQPQQPQQSPMAGMPPQMPPQGMMQGIPQTPPMPMPQMPGAPMLQQF